MLSVMWVRKPADQIAVEDVEPPKVTARVKEAALLAAFVSTMIVIVRAVFGIRGRFSLPADPWTLRETVAKGPTMFLYLFLVSFTGFFVFKRQSRFPTSYICTKCFKPQYLSQTGLCDCGGALEPLHHFEWIESKEADSKPSASGSKKETQEPSDPNPSLWGNSYW